jgi:PPOX class probable FMN-dependent enzyme
MADHFDELIATREHLRSLYRQPSERAHNKVIDNIDDVCRRFIAAAPFVIVASRGADGRLDVSPKGDPPGFVAVLDERTLAIPDRLGNNRLDTFDNLLVHPEVALLFMIPGNGETLRVSGTARLVRDAALQARLAVDGRTPNLVVVVTVEEVFIHCPKCIARSKLWSPDRWPDRANVPSLAEALVAHAVPSQTVAEVEAAIGDQNTRLY